MNTPALRRAAALAITAIIGLSACSTTSDSAASDVGTTEMVSDTAPTADKEPATDWVDGTVVAAASDTVADLNGGVRSDDVAAAAETVPAIADSFGDSAATEAPAEARKASPEQPSIDVGEPDPNRGSQGLPGGDVWDDRPPEPDPTYPPRTSRPIPPTTLAGIQARDGGVNPSIDTRDDTKSTFAMDVDTGSYTLARTQVNSGVLPSYDSVRTEEFVNYFDQQYRSPEAGKTFAIHVDGTGTPFLRSDTRIVRVGVQGRRIDAADRKPVHLTFVVDNSGSMEEDGKLRMVQTAMTTMLASLRPGDKISIVGFSDDAWMVLRPTDATDRAVIADAIARMAPTNGTNAEAGLDLGYSQAQAMYSSGATNRVILLSDGVANVGPTGPEAILARIGDFARRDIDLSTVGVGTTSYNDEMMERLADAGNGMYLYIDSAQEAERVFTDKFVSTVETIARNAKVQVEFDASTVASYRLLGFENRAVADRDFTNDSVDAGEIGAGHSITALYEVTLKDASGKRNDTLATVRLRWEEPNGKVKEAKQSLRRNAIASQFSSADRHLRLDVVTAAYAEVLRQGPWSRIMDLSTVAANAQRLVGPSGVFAADPAVQELADLTEVAARLRPSRTW